MQKVYVNQDNTAVIKCPACEGVKTIPVQQFKGTKHIIKIKCACQELFHAQLEFRKAYRKEIKLGGDYFHLPSQQIAGKMRVLNISMSGLGFTVVGRHGIQVGQPLRVRFNLDDKHHSEIDKPAVVRLVKDNYIGCEFKNTGVPDKALGFYLMP